MIPLEETNSLLQQTTAAVIDIIKNTTQKFIEKRIEELTRWVIDGCDSPVNVRAVTTATLNEFSQEAYNSVMNPLQDWLQQQLLAGMGPLTRARWGTAGEAAVEEVGGLPRCGAQPCAPSERSADPYHSGSGAHWRDRV